MSTALVTTAAEPLSLDPAASAAGQPSARRPTSQVTVEAVMWAVRQRGLSALYEPANQQRLLNCDALARTQINQRIEALLEANHIPGSAIDA
jgi:hypothetical protein